MLLKVGCDELKMYILNPRISTHILKNDINCKLIVEIKWNKNIQIIQRKAEKDGTNKITTIY